jgi:metallo-beta-lactamase family protein
LKLLQPVAFGVPVDLRDVSLSLFPSGHIPGASTVCLTHAGSRFVFSGDLGRMHDTVMAPPSRMKNADYLVVESTYGNRRHNPADPMEQLAGVIRMTAERGGVVLIPAFAVGRTQTLLHFIHLLKERGAIPGDLPVFLNSPMATQATEASIRYFDRHPEEHRLSRQQIAQMGQTALFIDSPEESRRLNEREGPMVIIAGSGMATGGRVVHHLKAFAPEPRNTILFAGFQAGGTRGGAMVAGANSVKIHGEYVPVRAQVSTIENLSAHADAGEILQWLRGFERAPKETFINHGEPAAADALRRDIEEGLGWKCRVPDYLEEVALA